jgi:hypothetical protein
MEFYIMAIKKSSSSGIPFGLNAGRPANPGFGQLYANGETARLELFTQASGWQNIVQETPGVSSITGNYLESTNSGVITIAGTNFVSGAYATAIGSNGVQVDATSTVFNSLVQLTATFTGLSSAYEPYDIKVTNPSNLFGLLPDALYVNNNPVWTTPAGSLGTFAEQVNATIYALSVSDDSTITYSLANGSSLPSGVTLSSNGVISGTLPDVSSDTTYTFTVNATDGLNPSISRTFSFVSNASPVWSTVSGSLGTFNKNTSISVTVAATDVSDSVSYALAAGSSLPSGITLNSSTGVISGTLPSITSDTTYNFTINALDGINTVSRAFSITSQNLVSVEYLVVAGGGGGGGITVGGGGGAGGMITGTSNLAGSSSISISLSVGQGGTGVQQGGTDATNGSNSTLSFAGGSSLTAVGGGAGGNYSGGSQPGASRPTGANGGSGGGGGDSNRTGGTGVSGQGNSGGRSANTTWAGGGGGGAGSAGTQPSNNSKGGNGGDGLQSSITGTATYYAGGGGGCSDNAGGDAGLGGGGLGGGNSPSRPPTAGAANTGGGGGAARDNPTGGAAANGGSGVVVIAYPSGLPAPTIPGTLTYDTPTRPGYKVYRFTSGSGTVTI